jgi:hypothetical protein
MRSALLSHLKKVCYESNESCIASTAAASLTIAMLALTLIQAATENQCPPNWYERYGCSLSYNPVRGDRGRGMDRVGHASPLIATRLVRDRSYGSAARHVAHLIKDRKSIFACSRRARDSIEAAAGLRHMLRPRIEDVERGRLTRTGRIGDTRRRSLPRRGRPAQSVRSAASRRYPNRHDSGRR